MQCFGSNYGFFPKLPHVLIKKITQFLEGELLIYLIYRAEIILCFLLVVKAIVWNKEIGNIFIIYLFIIYFYYFLHAPPFLHWTACSVMITYVNLKKRQNAISFSIYFASGWGFLFLCEKYMVLWRTCTLRTEKSRCGPVVCNRRYRSALKSPLFSRQIKFSFPKHCCRIVRKQQLADLGCQCNRWGFCNC